MRGKFNRTIVAANSGAVVPYAMVDVFDQATGDRVDIYSSQTGGTPISNPFESTSLGFVSFFLDAGQYRFVARSAGGAFISEITHEVVVDPSIASGIYDVIEKTGTDENIDYKGISLRYLQMTNSSAKTLTFRPFSSFEISVGEVFNIRNSGAGLLTVIAGSGVTINPPTSGVLTIEQNGSAAVICIAEDEYDMIGVAARDDLIETWAGISSVTPTAAGQLFTLKQHTSGGLGGGALMAFVGSVADDGGTQKNALGGFYLKRVGFESLDVTMFGALLDGTTDDSAAWNKCRLYAVNNGSITITVPAGTTRITSASSISFTNNVTITGAGIRVSVIKADLPSYSEFVTYTGNGFFNLRNLTIDGNRSASLNSSYCLYLSGDTCVIDNVEITGAQFAGVFTGSAASTSKSHKFLNCYIHDNGATTVGGNGVGIFGGGATPTDDVLVDGCRIIRNYCINTAPGDSTAINAEIKAIKVVNSDFYDNYNVNGGQVAIAGGATGANKINAIISKCTFGQFGTFGGELTCGIEIAGCDFIVSDCIVKNATVDAVRVEADSARGIVKNNILYAGTATGTGVNLITSGGTGGSKIFIDSNLIMSGQQGLSLQAGITDVFARNNYITAGITTPVAGEINFKELRGNSGYAPASPDLTAGVSPWTSIAQPHDCLVVLKTPNGISALTIGGANLPITAGTNFFLKSGRLFIATWTGTAPVFSYIQQQR